MRKRTPGLASRDQARARARSPAPRGGLPAALASLALACVSPTAPISSGDDDDGGGSTGMPLDPPVGPTTLQAACALAPRVSSGRWSATAAGSDAGLGVCSAGTAELFARIVVPVDADLRVRGGSDTEPPIVALAPPVCVAVPPHVCVDGGAVAELRDVPGGTEVLAIIESATASEVWIDVEIDPLLPVGAVCVPSGQEGSLGARRCATGSVCEAVGDEDSTARCREIRGESCARAELHEIDLGEGGGEFALDWDGAQTDAHVHGCAGDGSTEHVVTLAWTGAPTIVGGALHVWAQAPVAALAVRSPTCAPEDEVACAGNDGDPVELLVDDLDGRRARGDRPVLFVELDPGAEGGWDALVVHWAVVDSP